MNVGTLPFVSKSRPILQFCCPTRRKEVEAGLSNRIKIEIESHLSAGIEPNRSQIESLFEFLIRFD